MGAPETWAASRTFGTCGAKQKVRWRCTITVWCRGQQTSCQGPERKYFGLAFQVASVAITQLSCCALHCSPEVATGIGWTSGCWSIWSTGQMFPTPDLVMNKSSEERKLCFLPKSIVLNQSIHSSPPCLVGSEHSLFPSALPALSTDVSSLPLNSEFVKE